MKGFITQIIVIVLVFNLVSVFKETSMLSSWNKDKVQNFQLTTLAGNSESLYVNNTIDDQKTIVYFFAPWCSICRVSIKNLQNLYERDDNTVVVAVALDFVNKDEVSNFAHKLNLSFPILFGNEEVKQAYKVSAYPSYYVINGSGEVVHRSMGYSTALGLFLRSR